MVYQHADKIVNLRQGLPIGAMVTGAAGIGNKSFDTLLKDLRRRFNGEDEARRDWRSTRRDTRSRRSQSDFVASCSRRKPPPTPVGSDPSAPLRLFRGPVACRGLGDLAARPSVPGADAGARRQDRQPLGRGIRGASRLIFGLGTGFEDAAAHSGLTAEAARDLHAKLSPALFELLFIEAMPIRDAVDLARFLVETTIGFVKVSIARPKTVGGSIAIAAITKHEGFQWVQRQNGFGAGRPKMVALIHRWQADKADKRIVKSNVGAFSEIMILWFLDFSWSIAPINPPARNVASTQPIRMAITGFSWI